MRKITLIPIFLSFACFIAITSRFAFGQNDDGIPDNCEYSSGAYYQPDVFPRYELHNRRVVLVNWLTGEVVQEVEISLETDYFAWMGWSPDCRYLSARVGGAGLVIWDVPNSQRVGVFENTRPYPNTYNRQLSPVFWDASSTYALIEAHRGAYLFHPISGAQNWISSEYTFNHIGWALGRGLVFLVRYDSSSYITAYNLQTGEEVGLLNRRAPIYTFALSPDERYLLAGAFNRTFVWDLANFPVATEPVYELYGRGRIRFVNNTTVDILPRHSSLYSAYRYYLPTGSGRTIYYYGVDRTLNDPSGNYALMVVDDGLYLWQAATQNRILLADRRLPIGEPFWDMQRGQVLVMERDIKSYNLEQGHTFQQVTDRTPVNGVFAYDLATGAQVGWYPLGEHEGPPNFTLSPDESKIIVFTDGWRAWRLPGLDAGVVVWDRAGQGSVEVDVEDWTANRPNQVALSPDNRYLVIGYRALRVWDLQSLPPNMEDRDPIYRHEGPVSVVASVRFVNDHTLETTSADGVQYWDLHTGEQVGQP